MDRIERVGRLLQQIISEMVLQEHVRDPRVNKLITIHEIEVSRDLRHATVHVGGFLDTKQLSESVDGLNAAAGFIQAGVAKRVRWKATPKLRFVVDTKVREAQEMLREMGEHGI